MIVRLSDIKKMLEFRKKLNKIPLKRLTILDDNGKIIELKDNEVDEWELTGLNNIDFIRYYILKDNFLTVLIGQKDELPKMR